MSLLGNPHHDIPCDEESRCPSCPWPVGTACGGAEGVCEGNFIYPTPMPPDPLDRAARWAHELAEVERVITERRGERNDTHVGAPLHEIVAALLDETKAEERYWGGVDMADRITTEVMAQAIKCSRAGTGLDPTPLDFVLAERVVTQLALKLGWPP